MDVLFGLAEGINGNIYASTAYAVYRMSTDGEVLDRAAYSGDLHAGLRRPAVSEDGYVIAVGGSRKFWAFDGLGNKVERLGSLSAISDALTNDEQAYMRRGEVYSAHTKGLSASSTNPDGASPRSVGPTYPESEVLPQITFGAGRIVALGSDDGGASFIDVVSGEDLGRLDADDSRTLFPRLFDGNDTIYASLWALARDERSPLIAFNRCGREKWRWGSTLPGEIQPLLIDYSNRVIARRITQDYDRGMVVLTSDGSVVGTELAGVEPMLIGADGTIYGRTCDAGGGKGGVVIALDRELNELWRVRVGELGCPSEGFLSESGVLYVGGRSIVPPDVVESATVLAIQTTSAGLAETPWPALHHDNRGTGWMAP